MVGTGKVLNELGKNNIKSPFFGFQDTKELCGNILPKKVPKLSFTEPK